jgi:hypothetical protein
MDAPDDKVSYERYGFYVIEQRSQKNAKPKPNPSSTSTSKGNVNKSEPKGKAVATKTSEATTFTGLRTAPTPVLKKAAVKKKSSKPKESKVKPSQLKDIPAAAPAPALPPPPSHLKNEPHDPNVIKTAGFTVRLGDRPSVPMDISSSSSDNNKPTTTIEGDEEEMDPFDDMISTNARDNLQSHLQGDRHHRVKVVLDAANIGRSGLEKGPREAHAPFDADKLQAAVAYFEALDIDVTAFLPAAMVRRRPNKGDSDKSNARMQTESVDTLNGLITSKKVTLVPAGADDDMYVLNYSRENNCFIVSNDFFKDHVVRMKAQNDSLGRSMQLWLDENRSSYTFVEGTHFMPNPGSNLARTVDVLRNVGCGSGAGSGPGQAVARALYGLDSAVSSIVAVCAQGQGHITPPPSLLYILLARAELCYDAKDHAGTLRDIRIIADMVSSSSSVLLCLA